MSPHTGRVFVYDAESERFQDLTFKLVDGLAGPQEVVEALKADPSAMRQARKFAREWLALRAVQRQELAGRLLCTPLSGRQPSAPTGSTKRFSTMEEFLEKGQPAGGEKGQPAGGVTGPEPRCETWRSEKTQRLWSQEVLASGERVCLFCCTAYDDATRRMLDHPFCTEVCLQAYRARVDSGAARSQLARLERGRCQLCGVDAHALWEEVKRMPDVHARRRRLEREEWGTARLIAQIAADPREGLFWQADHIVPVAEGGGEADMSNYRTLCTPCHAKETSKLRVRLRDAARSKGCGDIRSFLKGQAPPAPVTWSDSEVVDLTGE